MATKISQKAQEYRPPPFLGIIPKKTVFFTASLRKMSQIQAEYYVTLWCECQTLANR